MYLRIHTNTHLYMRTHLNQTSIRIAQPHDLIFGARYYVLTSLFLDSKLRRP